MKRTLSGKLGNIRTFPWWTHPRTRLHQGWGNKRNRHYGQLVLIRQRERAVLMFKRKLEWRKHHTLWRFGGRRRDMFHELSKHYWCAFACMEIFRCRKQNYRCGDSSNLSHRISLDILQMFHRLSFSPLQGAWYCWRQPSNTRMGGRTQSLPAERCPTFICCHDDELISDIHSHNLSDLCSTMEYLNSP